MERKLQVLIVDDEPIALGIMETYVRKIPGMEIIAKCRNALEAFSVLSRQKADLLLLDINMPEITGIDFLKTLKDPPAVIFTTAYSEFALESYDLNAVDYLLKPIPFERFLKAVEKVKARMEEPVAAQEDALIFVKSGSKLIRIKIDELLYVEGLKDYIKLNMLNGVVVVHGTMKSMEEQLQPHEKFIRVHKSYLVNLGSVTQAGSQSLVIKDREIPVGSTYKEELQKKLSGFKLL